MTNQMVLNTSKMLSTLENASSSLSTSASLVMTISSHLLEVSTSSFTTFLPDYSDQESSSDYTYFSENGSEMSPNGSNKIHNFEEHIPVYDDYMYEAYSFERPIYLYICEILVIITALVNVLVIIVLLSKKMRNPTNMILAAIAITDTLTGLVTLPTYLMVYQNFEKATDDTQHSDGMTNETALPAVYDDMYTGMDNETQYVLLDAYKLSKSLCQWFMLSKFFFSKLFHTCSIFLTLFLGIQRFVSIKYPYSKMFTNRTVLIICISIFILSPFIHIYHLFKEKAKSGVCQWEIRDCKTDCVYLWASLFIRHLIPCAILSLCTTLFIIELRKTYKHVGGNREQIALRESENRRITIMVTSIVIAFLVPEIPYGVFLMMSVIYKHTNTAFHLETNRAIHAAYEITLIVSFHSNFYIYMFLNKRFRSGLKSAVLFPIRCVMGDKYSWSVHTGSTTSSRNTAQSSLVSRSTTRLRQMDRRNVGNEAHQILQTDSADNTETKLTNGSNSSDNSINN